MIVICDTYSEMLEVLRICKEKGAEGYWNSEELRNGELIVYVRKEEKNESKGLDS